MQALNKAAAALFTLFAPFGVQAATTVKSCSAVDKPGYVITKVISNSSACSGNSQYTFTLLAGETRLDTCVRATPAGWINNKQTSYTGTGTCGTYSGTPKQIWQITNTRDQIKLNSCTRTLPTGWVVTRVTNYSGSGDCGQTSGTPRQVFEAQSTAGQKQMNACSGSVLPTGWQVGSTSSSSVCGTTSGNLWKLLNTTPLTKVALHRYFSSKTGDNLYTVKRDDTNLAKYGYSYDAIIAYVPTTNLFGTSAFHRYFKAATSDSLYTTTRDDAGNAKSGYTYSSIAAYLYTAKVTDSVPLHRYWNPTNKHHLYTTQYFTNGAYGFQYEKIEGYLYTKP
ncbi:MAG: hypothetical protein AAAB13_17140 [Pseudomonas sp.]